MSGSTCTVSSTCGNGALDASEECDDSNTSGGDGCSLRCSVEQGYACSRIDSTAQNPDVCVLLCGDSALDIQNFYMELCDDGNTATGDGCSSSC